MKEFLVFVCNIPYHLYHYKLEGIFQKVGRVSEAYINIFLSWKQEIQEQGLALYGFRGQALYDFRDQIKQQKVPLFFNNASIKGRGTSVRMADYEKCRWRDMITYSKSKEEKHTTNCIQ